MTGVRDYSTGAVALAKAARALELPIVVTTTARDCMWGPTFQKLATAFLGVPIIDRSSVNAFADRAVAQAIARTDRKKPIFAGICLEVWAAVRAMTAIGIGTPVWVSRPPERSAGPNCKSAFCSCCKPVWFSSTTPR